MTKITVNLCSTLEATAKDLLTKNFNEPNDSEIKNTILYIPTIVTKLELQLCVISKVLDILDKEEIEYNTVDRTNTNSDYLTNQILNKLGVEFLILTK